MHILQKFYYKNEKYFSWVLVLKELLETEILLKFKKIEI